MESFFLIYFRINGRKKKTFKRVAAWILIKVNIDQWIRLDKFYKLMGSFFLISNMFSNYRPKNIQRITRLSLCKLGETFVLISTRSSYFILYETKNLFQTQYVIENAGALKSSDVNGTPALPVIKVNYLDNFSCSIYVIIFTFLYEIHYFWYIQSV